MSDERAFAIADKKSTILPITLNAYDIEIPTECRKNESLFVDIAIRLQDRHRALIMGTQPWPWLRCTLHIGTGIEVAWPVVVTPAVSPAVDEQQTKLFLDR